MATNNSHRNSQNTTHKKTKKKQKKKTECVLRQSNCIIENHVMADTTNTTASTLCVHETCRMYINIYYSYTYLFRTMYMSMATCGDSLNACARLVCHMHAITTHTHTYCVKWHRTANQSIVCVCVLMLYSAFSAILFKNQNSYLFEGPACTRASQCVVLR